MKKCPKCFTECSDEVRFCISCGCEFFKDTSSVIAGKEKICPKCGGTNPTNAVFCGKCGASLTVQPEPAPVAPPTPDPAPSGKVCPKCGHQCLPDATYCGKCGASLTVQPEPAPVAPPTPDPAPSGKVCPKCGHQCAADKNFCPKCGFHFCGAAPVHPGPDSVNTITLQQYYESYADPALKKNISAMFWVFLVLAIINFVVGIALDSFPLDGLVLLGLAFFWKFSPGLPCALTAVGYAVLSFIIGLALYGTFTGWLIPVAAILMFVYARKLNNAYNSFIANCQ